MTRLTRSVAALLLLGFPACAHRSLSGATARPRLCCGGLLTPVDLDYDDVGAREQALCTAMTPPIMLARTVILGIEAPFLAGIGMVALPVMAAKGDMRGWWRGVREMSSDFAAAFYGEEAECKVGKRRK